MPHERGERELVRDYLRCQPIGPANGACEELTDNPTARYLTGVLFPQGDEGAPSPDESEDEGQTVGDPGEPDDSPLSLAFERMPASAGFSFYVESGRRLEVDLSGATYRRSERVEAAAGDKEAPPAEEGKKKSGKTKVWRRAALGTAVDAGPTGESERIRLELPVRGGTIEKAALQGRAKLHVIARSRGAGFLVTLTLINTRVREKCNGRPQPHECLFQVGARCRSLDGRIGRYPVRPRTSGDEEEEELELGYRHRATFAVGHGCAASWTPPGGPPEYVEMTFLPEVEVPAFTTKPAEGKDLPVLQLRLLADDSSDPEELCARLDAFVDDYGSWLEACQSTEVPEELEEAMSRLLDRVERTLHRMRKGVQLLREDATALTAFRLANRAMLLQMIHAGPAFGGGRIARNERTYAGPDLGSEDVAQFRWRPFQLGFQLEVLESLARDSSVDRETVDLVWFPTGGGKTEAYLGLAAFELFRRRLVDGRRGGGTAVIKRYTMRLLTTQQFLRASTLICACEVIRRESPDLLGETPFSIGLWVGGEVTPNSFADAAERYEDLLNAEEPDENPFQLGSCPWCGTHLLPARRSDDPGDYGVRASGSTFEFHCPTRSCVFHDGLPVQVVDEALFTAPPSLLLATVDKFARIAWDARAGAFLGTDARFRAPSLIIQDELHLISGPLGTIAGLYEAALSTVIERAGNVPKIIAATATIRRASEQVRALYGRPVHAFPPPGPDARDSYFARVDTDVPGRLYLGCMGQGHTPVTSLVHCAAALLEGATLPDLEEPARDTWWTLVIYHNSRRELGKTMTLARDDIPERVRVITGDEARMRKELRVEELSSNVRGGRLGEVLEALGTPWGSGHAIDVLPCTNMISVGVDVSRLGVMLVNGQPKTTAEYIQATSRVGRDPGRPPGIVFTLYSPTKPRDRSHYEHFVGYHESLYRHVEPTSLTPYAEPARRRAMHAAVVAVLRLVGGLEDNDSAGRFDPDDLAIRELFESLESRMLRADDSERNGVERDLRRIGSEWSGRIEEARENGSPLRFSGGRQFTVLLRAFDDLDGQGWPTLNSMRNVDQEVRIWVAGSRRE